MSAADTIYSLGFTAFFAIPLTTYLFLVATGRVSLPPAKEKAAGRRVFGPFFIGYYYWMMRPVFRAAERSNLTPNQVTAISAFAAMATGIAIATGHFALGSALLIGGSSLDMVDGELARKKKLSTPGGAFFDSTMDRVCDGFIFGGCVIYYAGTAMMQVSLVVLITSFVVSYTRARAEALGLYGAEGLAQRADRIVMLGIAMAFSPIVAHRTEGFVPHPHYWITAGIICVLAVLNTATAVSRIRWTMRQLSHPPAPQALPIRAPAREASMVANDVFEQRDRSTA
jgi:CDP-diacylglycerol---glycerol-3-phosphate 3-phosphatidyltransferase